MPLSGVLKLIVVLAIPACASTMPQTFTGLTSVDPADSYTCALSQLARAEYVVLDAERDAGFIRAERQRSGAGTQLLTGQTFFDLVTVTLIPEGDVTTIQATAASQVEEGGRRRSTGIATHDRAKEMATDIVTTCGGGTR